VNFNFIKDAIERSVFAFNWHSYYADAVAFAGLPRFLDLGFKLGAISYASSRKR
jgi:hypothetical protein